MVKKVLIFVFIFLMLNLGLVLAQQDSEVKYCCEKTDYGAWCQEAPEEQCSEEHRMTPTNCESTSYCELGCCYDSSEGTCMESTPQKVCNDAGGTWSPNPECGIQQCQLGCCLLGNEASYVTLTRCKKLSSEYGLDTDFRRNVDSEAQCIALANEQDEGACVYEVDYSKTCKYTTRQECNSMQGGDTENGTLTGNISFHEGFLCSADELGTDCGPTERTTCKDGKVYWVDSCGNRANVYDASKVDDKSYWRKKVEGEELCGGKGSKNSRSCGNCDYFSGSTCKDYRDVDGPSPEYGTKICSSLDCPGSITSDGQTHQHGESWCSTDSEEDAVGSRYIRHICMNGEEIIEPCADYRQQVCLEESSEEGFTQAACVANRWEDCYQQTNKDDCENEDQRDCEWVLEENEVEYEDTEEGRKPEEIGCFAEHPPGLKFWEEKAKKECSIGNKQCVVEFVEKGIIRNDENCEDNCECLEDSWKEKQLERCELIGDCGAKSNWAGQSGNKDGYNIEKEEREEGGGGGLFGLTGVFRRFMSNLGLLEVKITGDTVNEIKEENSNEC